MIQNNSEKAEKVYLCKVFLLLHSTLARELGSWSGSARLAVRSRNKKIVARAQPYADRVRWRIRICKRLLFIYFLHVTVKKNRKKREKRNIPLLENFRSNYCLILFFSNNWTVCRSCLLIGKTDVSIAASPSCAALGTPGAKSIRSANKQNTEYWERWR